MALGGTPAITPWDTFEENLKSFAHMAVASLVGRTWCLDFDYFRAHNENAVKANFVELRTREVRGAVKGRFGPIRWARTADGVRPED